MSITSTRVDPTNHAQEQAWDGTEGGYWATHAEQFDDALRHYQPTSTPRPGSAPTTGCSTSGAAPA